MGWDCGHPVFVFFLSLLYIRNSHPGIVSQILSLFVLPQAMSNQNEVCAWSCTTGLLIGEERDASPLLRDARSYASHPALEEQTRQWLPFFLWAFILPQCYMWDFTGIKKADERDMTSAHRAAALLNSMPNLFL